MKKKIIKNQKGVAIILTLLSLLLLSIIGFGLISVGTSQSRAVRNIQDSNNAYYMARTGVARAMAELETNYTWMTGKDDYYELNMGENGKYTVDVWAPAGNMDPLATSRIWKIVSTGEYNGSVRTLEAWAKYESFALFCYFTDSEKIGSTTIWFTDSDYLDGRVHTNGYFSIYQTPYFTNKVTSYNRYDSKYDRPNRRYKQSGYQYDPQKFYRYYNNYDNDIPTGGDDFSFAGGEPEIELPYDTSLIEANANKKYNGDVYIWFLDSGKAKVRYYNSGWREEYISTQNLILHASDDIFIKGGKVRGSVTLGCGDDIFIEDSFEYVDKNVDVMGLVADDDIVITTDKYTVDDLTLHAIMMALNGSFYVKDYNKGNPRGLLSIYGGLIQYERGPVGTFRSGYGTVTGYDKDYRYDPKLLLTPPPNFPNTGNLELLSLKDSGAFYE
ncbi:MAG: DUF4900 domain-containing protein [Vulcanimicrobiota bacterium]